MNLYLLKMVGDVYPELDGPFENEDERNDAAIAHRDGDPEMEDGLFRLDIDEEGTPSIYPYSGGFFMEEE